VTVVAVPPENPHFGGLTPTSSTEATNEKMSKEDAGEQAWEKVFGASAESV